MEKKYELIAEKTIEVFGRKLFKIRALVDIESIGVKAGEEGGYVEREYNLSHFGNAWVSGNARVYGNAEVSGNARVYGNAEVYGNARVSGNARVYGNAEVSGNARVYGDARVDHKYKIMTISNMGSVQRTTTFFVCKDGKIRVMCGCFYGDLEEFRAQVKETHKDTQHARAYLAAVDFVEATLDTNVEVSDE